MSFDMSQFSEYELREDLAASEMDAIACERVAPERFKERIDGNRKIVAAIRTELKRRGLA